MSTTTVGYEVEYSEGMTKAVQAKQNTSQNENVEAIRLAVEVVCLMRRFGYKVKDDTVLEVIELCTKVADEDLP
jgi:hypothetical protein